MSMVIMPRHYEKVNNRCIEDCIEKLEGYQEFSGTDMTKYVEELKELLNAN